MYLTEGEGKIRVENCEKENGMGEVGVTGKT